LSPATTIQNVHSSRSVEWYTPAVYIDAVREVLGEIDLDPASCTLANETVRAHRYLTMDDDGLQHPWHGRIFLNPPYGRTQGQSNQDVWTRKLIEEWELQHVQAAILLVNACIGDRWFNVLWDYPLCFADRRIRFNSPTGSGPAPTKGNCFAYFGEDPAHFADTFAEHGQVIIPEGDTSNATRRIAS
jgi:ParB family chromosome partitioning protein